LAVGGAFAHGDPPPREPRHFFRRQQRRGGSPRHCRRDQHGAAIRLAASQTFARLAVRWRLRREAGAGPENGAAGPAGRIRAPPRLYAAAAVAHWAMRPAAVAGTLPLLRCFPRVLSWGARLSGKATRVVTPQRD